jgi:hypothetical protein
MSDGTLLTGKRGAGKSLLALNSIRDRLAKNCMVATNLNLYVDKLVSPRNKIRPFRLPDWPIASDMETLPLGNPALEWVDGQIKIKAGYDEGMNGLLVLDELATFMNSRNWQAKDRQELINWLLQSRKFGWDLLFLAQHPRLVDAQIRDSLFDLIGVVRRLDKISVPFFGRIAGLIGLRLKMPRIHIAALRYGMHQDSPVAERIWCRGSDLFHAYDTTQKIDPALGVKTGEGFQYLSAWDLRGRYMGWWDMNKKIVLLLLCFGLVCGFFSGRYYQHQKHQSLSLLPTQPVEEKFAQGVTAKGFYRDGNTYRIILSDGRTLTADSFKDTPAGWQAKAGAFWYKGEKQ